MKLNLKNNAAIYLSHPMGAVNGGIHITKCVNKIAQCTNITQEIIPKEAYKQSFARHYEIKEESTAKMLSELFENLKSETNDACAICFTAKVLDEVEIPKDLEKHSSTIQQLFPLRGQRG